MRITAEKPMKPMMTIEKRTTKKKRKKMAMPAMMNMLKRNRKLGINSRI